MHHFPAFVFLTIIVTNELHNLFPCNITSLKHLVFSQLSACLYIRLCYMKTFYISNITGRLRTLTANWRLCARRPKLLRIRWNLSCRLLFCEKMPLRFYFHKQGNKASKMFLKVNPPSPCTSRNVKDTGTVFWRSRIEILRCLETDIFSCILERKNRPFLTQKE